MHVCVNGLAKHREQLPGIIVKLMILSMTLMLTGEALSRVPEQEDREGEPKAEFNPGEVTLVSSWYRFCWFHFPTVNIFRTH